MCIIKLSAECVCVCVYTTEWSGDDVVYYQ